MTATLNRQTATIVQPPPNTSPSRSGPHFPADQATTDTQMVLVGGDHNSQQQARRIADTVLAPPAAALNVEQEHGQRACETQSSPAMFLFDPLLSTLADGLDDAEKTKNAQANRLRQLTRTEVDADGEERGFGLDATHPAVAALAAQVEALEALNAAMTKALQKQLKQSLLYPWLKAQRGVGDKTAARLLHAVRDPYWNDLHNRPRTVSELWAFCGLHVLPAGHEVADAQRTHASGSNSAGGDTGQGVNDAQRVIAGVAARRQRGQKSNWSTNAKTRTWLIVESCMKQLDPACKTDTGIADHTETCGCSPYRVVVDTRRKHTAVTHPDWTPKHSLNDGMRVASKALLRDLWVESKRLYETNSRTGT